MAQVITGEGLKVFEAGGFRMIALEQEASRVVARVLYGGSSGMDKYGFHTYANGATVVIGPGEIRHLNLYVEHSTNEEGDPVQVPDPVQFSILTDTYILSDLAPSSAGVLYVEIPTEDDDYPATGTPGGAGASGYEELEIGGGGFHYGFFYTARVRRKETISGEWNVANTDTVRYASEMPTGAGYFRKKLANVTVDGNGRPSVDRVHAGVIHMPMLFEYMSEFDAGEV